MLTQFSQERTAPGHNKVGVARWHSAKMLQPALDPKLHIHLNPKTRQSAFQGLRQVNYSEDHALEPRPLYCDKGPFSLYMNDPRNRIHVSRDLLDWRLCPKYCEQGHA